VQRVTETPPLVVVKVTVPLAPAFTGTVSVKGWHEKTAGGNTVMLPIAVRVLTITCEYVADPPAKFTDVDT